MYLKPIEIGNVKIDNNIFLAPMAGVTDIAFRKICKEFGVGMIYTEMASSKAIHYGSEKTENIYEVLDEEKPCGIQIFGHEPDIMAEICASETLDKFDIIDINMGCPAPKIVNNGDGSYLMTNINLAKDIITSCVKATKKPITVKFRSGYDKEHINAVEFAKMCEDAGASAITIHGRTRDQMYSGTVDLDIIKQVKQSVKIPVIASGDIVDKESYIKTLNYTGCDAVMIGRGALGNPYIFSDLLDITVDQSKIQIIKKHVELLRKYFPEEFIKGHIRKHFLWYLKGEKNASEIKLQVSTEPSLDKVIKILENYLKK